MRWTRANSSSAPAGTGARNGWVSGRSGVDVNPSTKPPSGSANCDAMQCDAMRCDAMPCDAMRCEAATDEMKGAAAGARMRATKFERGVNEEDNLGVRRAGELVGWLTG